MSRGDTIAREAYRAQHLRPDGTVMAEWNGEQQSRFYFNEITLTEGYSIRLQYRPAGLSRFHTLGERRFK